LRVSTNATCVPSFAVFDQSGHFIGNGYHMPGLSTSSFAVTSGETCYIVIVNAQATSGTISIMCESTPLVAVTGVTITPDTLELAPGEMYGLIATVSPANATNLNVTWETSDSNIVAFVFNGIVMAMNEGTATITVTTEDGGFTDTCDVTVAIPAVPYETWTTTSLAGGPTPGAPVAISLDQWYTSTATSAGSLWYSVPVSTAATYAIYWDDGFQGSGTYAGDLWVGVYHMDGSTVYGEEDSGYYTPLLVTPTETTLLIRVDPYDTSGIYDGTFAIGVHQQ
jgi:hypothetical protein